MSCRLAPLISHHAPRWVIGIGISFALHDLEHFGDHADVEVDMLVQAGAEAVNDGGCANVQHCLIDLRRCAGPLCGNSARGLAWAGAGHYHRDLGNTACGARANSRVAGAGYRARRI